MRLITQGRPYPEMTSWKREGQNLKQNGKRPLLGGRRRVEGPSEFRISTAIVRCAPYGPHVESRAVGGIFLAQKRRAFWQGTLPPDHRSDSDP